LQISAATNTLLLVKYSIAIEIENKKYIKVLSSEGKLSRRIDLTTIQEWQKKAIVSFFFVSEDKKQLIKSVELDLSKFDEARPVIHLNAEIIGYSLFLSFKVGRSTRIEERVNLFTQLFPWKQTLIASAAAIVLIAITAGLIWLAPNINSGISSPSNQNSTRQTESSNTSNSSNQTEPADQQESGSAEEPPAQEESAPVETPVETQEGSQAETSENQSEEAAPAATQNPPAVEEKETFSFIVYFNPDDAFLIQYQQNLLRDFFKGLTDVEVTQIHGHTALYNTQQNQQALSSERASQVESFLINVLGRNAVAEAEVLGLGASQPVTRDKEEEYQNRRVEIQVKANKN
jgi:outer membrane protein OmpA-like peptidoglycan-associated protein